MKNYAQRGLLASLLIDPRYYGFHLGEKRLGGRRRFGRWYPENLDLLVKQSIDGESLSQKITDPQVKGALVNETAMAIEKGVFGVPTIIVDGNLFWGNDQMGHLELLLSGQDPLDRDKLTALQKRPRAIDRKAFEDRG